jgi:ketosteroid isomerase-like protein
MAASGVAQTQNTPSPSTRKRTATSAPTPTTQTAQDSPTKPAAKTPSASDKDPKKNAASPNVTEVFEALLDGIRAADVKLVTGIYWNSPQLVLFNNNGTVTKGWEQMRKNRESSYPEMKDVVLDVRDIRVQMLGRDGALVTCLWTQAQTYKGVPETAAGRMTIVFRRLNGIWKAIHLHTSPDSPDASRVLTSEQPTTTPAKP